MNKKTALSIAALYIAPVAAVLHYLYVRRVERAKRAQIELNLENDLAAIRYAHAMVEEEIKNGEHPVPNLVSIQHSFYFHKHNAPTSVD